MDTRIARRPSWWARMLHALRLKRLDGPPVLAHVAGGDFAASVAWSQGYDPALSFAAYSRFSWLVACVRARAKDAAGVPLVAMRGDPGDPRRKRVPSHPALALLARPSSRVVGLTLRRQAWADFDLCGNWLGVILGRSNPEAVLRLHPIRTRVVPRADGQPGAYEYDSAGPRVSYTWERVLHVRDVSWEDTPEGLWGQGAIRALHDDLIADLGAQQGAARASRRGRPDAIVTPREDGDFWNSDQQTVLQQRLEQMLDEQHGGWLVMARGAEVKQLSWAPRDLEYGEQRDRNRQAMGAVLGVPPVRLGLETANYATAREQRLLYWESIRSDAALFEAEYTRLARGFEGSDDVWIEHDWARVPAFQLDRTERLNRVGLHVLNGMRPADAYAYEGFDDAPIRMTAAPAAGVGEDDADASNAAGLDAIFGTRSRAVLEHADARDVTAKRVAVAARHGATETALRVALVSFLGAQARRFAARIADVLGARGLAIVGDGDEPTFAWARSNDDNLETILADTEEAGLLREATAPTVRAAVRRAFRDAARQLGHRFDSERADAAVDRVLGELVADVSATTRATVRGIVLDGLRNGDSVATMQEAILGHSDFSSMRALRIARTETTRSLSGGALAAGRDARRAGVAVVKTWLSARDEATRPDHFALDGQRVPIDAPFVVPATAPDGAPTDFPGAEGQGPGDFDVPGLVVNCRCTVTLDVADEEVP